MLLLSIVAPLSFTIGFQSVRSPSSRKVSSHEKLNGTKQNSFRRLFVRKLVGSSSCVRMFFGKADASAQQKRTAKPWFMSFAFFTLKKYIPMQLFTRTKTYHHADQQLERDTPHRVESSAMPIDASQRLNVFHREKDIRSVMSWYHSGLPKHRLGQKLKGNTLNGKFRRPSFFAGLVCRNFVLEMRLCGTPEN